jgi:hypothetical protein
MFLFYAFFLLSFRHDLWPGCGVHIPNTCLGKFFSELKNVKRNAKYLLYLHADMGIPIYFHGFWKLIRYKIKFLHPPTHTHTHTHTCTNNNMYCSFIVFTLNFFSHILPNHSVQTDGWKHFVLGEELIEKLHY